MNIHDIIRGRRTVHRYVERALPAQVLERALDAATSAPNHGLTEPWRFARIGPETRHALVSLGLELAGKSGRGGLSDAAFERLRSRVLDPAELLVVGQTIHEDPRVRQEDYAAVACAIQNLMLALWADGVGSKWDTDPLMHHPGVYARLGIDPDQQNIVGFVWIGYAARDDAPRPRRRKPLSEIVKVLP